MAATFDQEFLQLFADVFAGRFDCYAIAIPHRNPAKAAKGKLEYPLQREPLTQQVHLDHLLGKRRVGVYPLVDNYVRWFAIDFDAPKVVGVDGEKVEIDDPFPVAWEEAERQAAAFEEAGIFCYLERSRSGKGVHLWGFFDEPVAAEVVLRALKPLLVTAESYDRMYPVQSEVDKKGFGNLIALPFHGESLKDGCTAFLNRDTLEPIGPEEFLHNITYNNRYVIEELAEKAPKQTTRALPVFNSDGDEVRTANFDGRPEKPLRGFFKLISPFGCKFMHHCVKDAKTISQTEWWVAIGQTTCFENGRSAAHLISALDPDRYDPQEVDAVYDRLMQHPPHGCAYIHANFPEHACSGCPMKAPYHVAKKPILELARESARPLAPQDWGDAVARIRRRASKKEQVGVSWATAGLDQYSRARRGEFIILGARPSVGKTAIAVDMLVNMARRGTPVLFFSAETGEEPMQDRILARVSGVDSKILRGESFEITPKQLKDVEAAAKELAKLPIYINYGATRADQILDLAEQTILEHRIPLDTHVVLAMDYIQFAVIAESAAGAKEYDRLSKRSTEYKYIAKILNQTFVALAQLKRESEGEDTMDMSDIKGTGQFEQDADGIFGLTGERIPGPIALRTLHILKQKEGEAGHSIPLKFHQTICHFEVLSHEVTPPKQDLFEGVPDGTHEL